MDFIVSLMRQTALVPLAVSVTVVVLLSRIPRLKSASPVLALCAGFFAGWADQEWTTLSPSRYLDWLPYVCVALTSVGLAGLRWHSSLMHVLKLASCFGAAWLLVPNFPRLEPPRIQAIFLVTVGSYLLVLTMDGMATRISDRVLAAFFMVSGSSAAFVLAQSFGLKFAQIAGMLTAALTGCLIVLPMISGRKSSGLSVVFLPLLCNLMFIGYANSSSDVPAFCYAVVLTAPCFLWIAVAKRETPTSKSLAASFAVATVVTLTLAIIPALLAHPPLE